MWTHHDEHDLRALVSHPLNGMIVACATEQATGISPRAAMTFFERAWPDLDRAALGEYLAHIAPAFEHPRVQALLSELREQLASRSR